MATTPSRSSSVPVKRSRLDLSPQWPAHAEGLKELFLNDALPPYCKVLVDVLIDTKKELADLARQCREILAENKSLKEENMSLRNQLRALMSSNRISESTQGNADGNLRGLQGLKGQMTLCHIMRNRPNQPYCNQQPGYYPQQPGYYPQPPPQTV
ncbi:hypothetical protein TELCIR_00421 [Teladorsagia circumcincta]|uniref:Uncharacterized protein n=1 Tax=Teladorsagia circumcincta TaxID=45464 RepID=A0A2G9V4N7_TELCI|nr:hypothetical protein TELCIR_00421 [Teladorsagia circumcincta]